MVTLAAPSGFGSSTAQVPAAWSASETGIKVGYFREHEGDWWRALQNHDCSAGTEPGTEGSAAYWEIKLDVPSSAQMTLIEDGALTNARTPTSHGADKHSQALVETGDSRLSDARTPTSHGDDKHTTGLNLLRIYADITAAKAATSVDGLIGVVLSPFNLYRGLSAGSAYTANDKSILITGDAGNTRWIGVGPLYVADGNLPNVITVAASGNLPANAVNGAFITNAGQSQANEQELPAAVAGMSFIATVETAGVGAFTLDPNGSEIIILNGTALVAGNKATCATPAVGDTIGFWCLTAGTWIANSSRGTWTDGGA